MEENLRSIFTLVVHFFSRFRLPSLWLAFVIPLDLVLKHTALKMNALLPGINRAHLNWDSERSETKTNFYTTKETSQRANVHNIKLSKLTKAEKSERHLIGWERNASFEGQSRGQARRNLGAHPLMMTWLLTESFTFYRRNQKVWDADNKNLSQDWDYWRIVLKWNTEKKNR